MTVESPWQAYRRARGSEPGFYLETGGGADGWGYFGIAPDTLVSVTDDAIPTLREVLEDDILKRGSCPIPVPGGWFGWLSYDVARELEALPSTTADTRDLPHLQLGKFETIAAWKTPTGEDAVRLHLVSTPRVETVETAYDRAIAALEAFGKRIVSGDPEVSTPAVEAAPFTSNCTADAYADRVRDVKRQIRDGETFQANISHRLSAPAAVHPVEAYGALREVNPAPYAGLLEYPGLDIVSASPELLLKRSEDRLETEPIAGTRPRGDTRTEDAEMAAELTSDEKEAAEHAMLVDLERNDLGKVSAYGTVEVPEYRRLDRYSEVMHLVSRVIGRLRTTADLADAVAAVFPGGTITGAPKPATMAIIDRVEAARRGPYTGSMAAIGFDGHAVLNIIIRTLVRHEETYTLRVGAGIVHDSDPEREFAETMDKAKALVTALSQAADTDLAGVSQ